VSLTFLPFFLPSFLLYLPSHSFLPSFTFRQPPSFLPCNEGMRVGGGGEVKIY
jgi:hypothetical protein